MFTEEHPNQRPTLTTKYENKKNFHILLGLEKTVIPKYFFIILVLYSGELSVFNSDDTVGKNEHMTLAVVAFFVISTSISDWVF
jgi:hypothetical protein